MVEARDLYLPSQQGAASRARKMTPTLSLIVPWHCGLALECASDLEPALSVQSCSAFFPPIPKLWNWGPGGSTHGYLALVIRHFLLTSGLIVLCDIPVWGLLARGFHQDLSTQ